VLAALLALGAVAARADGFSCGNRVITTGMPSAQVQAACGDPAEIRHDSILRRPVIWRHGRPWPVSDDPVEVPVERWLYNFGPNRLMRRLRFEDGILAEITTLGYGYNP
jgi:hypothetical protein